MDIQHLIDTPSDINEHLQTLMDYCNDKVVVEFGVRHAVSTRAILQTCRQLTSYDIQTTKEALEIDNPKRQFVCDNTLRADIEPCDILFIDTFHTAEQLAKELEQHTKVKEYMIFHDTITYGWKGENNTTGLRYALIPFLLEHKERIIKEHFTNNNGLLILQRK